MPSRKVTLRVSALSVILTLALTSCQTTGSGVRSVACETFKAIRWSKADTKPTIRQIVGHNAVGVKLCGWKPD